MFFPQPLTLQHPCREGGVRADRRGARQQGRIMIQGQPGNESEDSGTGDVDGQRPEWQRPAHPPSDGPVHHESQHRSGSPDDHDSRPDQNVHMRTRIRRTRAVAV